MALIQTPWRLKKTSEFYRELSALLGAGVPVLQSLEHIRRNPPSPSFRPHLQQTIRSVEAGSSLAGALAERGTWVTPFDLALLRAAEESGRLTETCRSLSQQYTDRARLIEGLIAKLLYPVFLLHFAILIFPPDLLAPIIMEGRIMPFLVQKVSVLAPLYGIVILILLFLKAGSTSSGAATVELVLRSIPGLGPARRELALARLAAALESLISAGITIIEAWDLAADASGSPALRRAVRRWRPAVLAGALPSEQLRRSREFPELFANLYTTGETSGQLDHELRHLQAYYEDSGNRRMGRFALVTGILITMGVMGTIAFWVVRFWLNYYQQIFRSVGM